MTTQHPSIRRLHRRTDDRVLAGVASGLGDYFNVDPLLIRILLVASIVFGGLGIFLYVAAWLLVPDDRSDQSIAERTLGTMSLPGGFLGGVLAVIGAVILLGIVGSIVADGGSGLAFAVIVVVIGALLLRRTEAGTTASAPEPAGDAAIADAGDATAPAPTVAPAAPAAPVAAPRPRVRRPPSPLGWYAVGAALVGIGLLAVADSAGILFPALEHYFGLAILVLGAALVIGAWWGRARALILVGLLLLPVAWTASLVDVPLEGGWGSRNFAPTTAAALRDTYRLAGGELVLDLTGYDGSDASVDIEASVGFGDLRVLLPEESGAEIDAAVGGGTIRLGDGPRLNGTHLDDRRSLDGDGTTFNLTLDAGIGAIRVDRMPMEDR